MPQMLPPFDVTRLHRLGLRGAGVRVAVVDTAIDRGWVPEVSGHEHFGSDAFPHDHGTLVGRIIADVAPAADIISLNISDGGPPHDPIYSYAAAVDALLWCLDHAGEIDIVNISFVRDGPHCSWADPCPLCELVHACAGRGIFVVAAAGNDGPREDSVGCPAWSPSACAVGYIDNTGVIAVDSSRGDPTQYNAPWKPNVVAPGTTSWVIGPWSGTSFAAPLVAGLAALVKSSPTPPLDLMGYICGRAIPVAHKDTGYGRVDSRAI